MRDLFPAGSRRKTGKNLFPWTFYPRGGAIDWNSTYLFVTIAVRDLCPDFRVTLMSDMGPGSRSVLALPVERWRESDMWMKAVLATAGLLAAPGTGAGVAHADDVQCHVSPGGSPA